MNFLTLNLNDMKMIDKKLKTFALATAFMVGGFTMTAEAQTHTGTQMQTEIDGEDEVDYREIFNGMETEQTESHDILSLLRMDDNFSIFVELIEESGLEKSFDFAGPVTVLAPTNEAFKQLTKEEYKELTEGKNRAELNKIVQAHVLPNKVYLRQFDSNHVIENPDGDIPVERAGNFTGGAAATNDIIVGGATIRRPDVEAANGVIHVVDGVIIPGRTGVTAGPF